MACPICRAPTRDGAGFCAQCGAELRPGCEACGTALRAQDRFCSACGHPAAARRRGEQTRARRERGGRAPPDHGGVLRSGRVHGARFESRSGGLARHRSPVPEALHRRDPAVRGTRGPVPGRWAARLLRLSPRPRGRRRTGNPVCARHDERAERAQPAPRGGAPPPARRASRHPHRARRGRRHGAERAAGDPRDRRDREPGCATSDHRASRKRRDQPRDAAARTGNLRHRRSRRETAQGRRPTGFGASGDPGERCAQPPGALSRTPHALRRARTGDGNPGRSLGAGRRR